MRRRKNQRLRPPQRPFGGAARQAEPELAVVLPGHHVLVGVGLDARRHPQQHLRHPAPVGDERLDAIELVIGVDDDATDGDTPPIVPGYYVCRDTAP